MYGRLSLHHLTIIKEQHYEKDFIVYIAFGDYFLHSDGTAKNVAGI
jgi:hypothetical protein